MKEGWEYKKLGEVCNIQYGYAFDSKCFCDNKDYPQLVRIRDVNRGFSETYYNGTIPDGYDVNRGDYLIGMDGEFNIAQWQSEKALLNQRVCKIWASKDIIDRFMFYNMRVILKQIEEETPFVTVKHLSAKRLNTICLPTPPLSEQQRIVEELDLLSSIIEKKKTQLKELDSLAQSIFYDMFGDPVTNEKGFPPLTVGDIMKFEGGSQPPKSTFELKPTNENIRLIQIRDYKTNDYITYIPKSLARKFCKKDDIMIGRYGPPIFQILKGLEGAYNVALMKAVPLKGNKEFIRAFLKQKCLLHYLETFSRRVAGQDGIQMDKLKSYPFPYPPIALQELFASKVEAIEHQKEMIKQSIKEVETLFNSRMDYYFDG